MMQAPDIESRLEVAGGRRRPAVRTTEATTPELRSPRRPPDRRRRGHLIAFVAAVAVILVAASVLFTLTSRDHHRAAPAGSPPPTTTSAATTPTTSTTPGTAAPVTNPCAAQFPTGEVTTEQPYPEGLRVEIQVPYQGTTPCTLPGTGPKIDLIGADGTVVASTTTTLYALFPPVTVKPGHAVLAGINWIEPCSADPTHRVTQLRVYPDKTQATASTLVTVQHVGGCSTKFTKLHVTNSDPLGVR